MNKYLIITHDNHRYKLSAENWSQALAKFFSHSNEWITAADFENLIKDKSVLSSIDMFNDLNFNNTIDFFSAIDELFDVNTVDIDEETRGGE